MEEYLSSIKPVVADILDGQEDVTEKVIDNMRDLLTEDALNAVERIESTEASAANIEGLCQELQPFINYENVCVAALRKLLQMMENRLVKIDMPKYVRNRVLFNCMDTLQNVAAVQLEGCRIIHRALSSMDVDIEVVERVLNVLKNFPNDIAILSEGLSFLFHFRYYKRQYLFDSDAVAVLENVLESHRSNNDIAPKCVEILAILATVGDPPDQELPAFNVKEYLSSIKPVVAILVGDDGNDTTKRIIEYTRDMFALDAADRIESAEVNVSTFETVYQELQPFVSNKYVCIAALRKLFHMIENETSILGNWGVLGLRHAIRDKVAFRCMDAHDNIATVQLEGCRIIRRGAALSLWETDTQGVPRVLHALKKFPADIAILSEGLDFLSKFIYFGNYLHQHLIDAKIVPFLASVLEGHHEDTSIVGNCVKILGVLGTTSGSPDQPARRTLIDFVDSHDYILTGIEIMYVQVASELEIENDV